MYRCITDGVSVGLGVGLGVGVELAGLGWAGWLAVAYREFESVVGVGGIGTGWRWIGCLVVGDAVLAAGCRLACRRSKLQVGNMWGGCLGVFRWVGVQNGREGRELRLDGGGWGWMSRELVAKEASRREEVGERGGRGGRGSGDTG